ncbi:MAG: hypothetical protein PHE20_03810 [Patescibacteria group bacterium]|nr:hypothetical protein [Patescibacteria group bacterium]
MEERELSNILQELYQLDISLREHEGILKEIIGQMSDLGSKTPFTPALAAQIKQRVMSRLQEDIRIPERKFSFNFINQQKYLYIGSALVLVLFLTVLAYRLPNFKQLNSDINKVDIAKNDHKEELINLALDSSITNEEEVVRLASNAFGSLSSVSGSMGVTSVAARDMDLAVPIMGDTTFSSTGSIEGASTISSEQGIARAMSSGAYGLGGDGHINASKMIAPWYQIKYVYTGEQLNLEEASGAVYKRLTGGLISNSSLLSLVKNLNFKDLDIQTFNSLKVTNLSLIEDKDKGLAVNFDFLNDNIYIYENWQKWQNPERDACGLDSACWDGFRTKISDVPNSVDLIAMSDKFIKDHSISLDHYGEAQVDNNWRDDYERSTDKANYYIPDYISVVYPLLVEDAPVLDQGGNLYGLRVNLSLLHKTAAGLNGLSPYRYQSSDYALETDFARIVKVAEVGMQTGMYYEGIDDNDIQEVELGTPSRAYVQYWQYKNNVNEELLVPALVFPVISKNSLSYYGQRSVVVPLVKELLVEREIRVQPGDMEIMPMVR